MLLAAAGGRIGVDHRFLHAVLDRPAETLPALLRFASEAYSAYPVNLEPDLVSLFRHLRAPEALPYYLAALREEPTDPYDNLVGAFADLGAVALEPLLDLYRILDEDESAETAFILASLGVHDERILAILLERLEYDAIDGSVSLSLYADPAANPAIRKLLAEIPAADTHLRHALESAIAAIETPGEPVVSDAFDIWEDVAETAPPDFDLLEEDDRIEALSNPSAEYRAAAAHSFFSREYSLTAKNSLFALTQNDTSPEVRARSWEALLESTVDTEIREAMQNVAADPNAPLVERAGAAVGLSQLSERPEVRAVFESLYAFPEVRAKALEAMWRSLDRSFAAYFPPHLDDADLETQRQAIWGTGYLGIHSEARRLERFFEEEDLRDDALFAYALAVPAQISPSRVRSLYRKIETLAGGLTAGESDLIHLALDERLAINDFPPVFHRDEAPPMDEPLPPPAAHMVKAGRNDPCPCGSGKKFKKCCGAIATKPS